MSKKRHKIADETELASDGARVIREVEGIEIAVFRIRGEYYALTNYCPHQAGPLAEGELKGRMIPGEDGWEWNYDSEEKLIMCPWHGWQFDVTTGLNVQNDDISVPFFEVESENGEIFVRI